MYIPPSDSLNSATWGFIASNTFHKSAVFLASSSSLIILYTTIGRESKSRNSAISLYILLEINIVLGFLLVIVGFMAVASVGLSHLNLTRHSTTFFGVAGGGVGENNATNCCFMALASACVEGEFINDNNNYECYYFNKSILVNFL